MRLQSLPYVSLCYELLAEQHLNTLIRDPIYRNCDFGGCVFVSLIAHLLHLIRHQVILILRTIALWQRSLFMTFLLGTCFMVCPIPRDNRVLITNSRSSIFVNSAQIWLGVSSYFLHGVINSERCMLSSPNFDYLCAYLCLVVKPLDQPCVITNVGGSFILVFVWLLAMEAGIYIDVQLLTVLNIPLSVVVILTVPRAIFHCKSPFGDL